MSDYGKEVGPPVTPCNHQLLRVMRKVGRARLELATNALKGRCSTIELPTRFREERREVMQRFA